MLTHPVYHQLKTLIDTRKTMVCVGLDPDMGKLPAHFPKTIQGIENFLLQVIEATSDGCIAYKPNLAFFEALGLDGLHLLERIRKHIPKEIPVVFDGKRGDIGNTSAMQARFVFDYFGADASTLHPYMGEDSLTPFFDHKDKLHFVLALTSNPGADSFEKKLMADGRPLYLHVTEQCTNWNRQYQNIGLVVGATQSELLQLRKATDLPFLIPGVGAQGGSYEEAVSGGKDPHGVALVNLSRGLLYVDSTPQFASVIRQTLASYKLS